MHLFQQYGFFILIPALFVVVGVGMFINITWGVLTGGPRALDEPGAPYLYNRSYYILFLIALIGWSGALLSALIEIKNNTVGVGFIVGWGICAIGMGSLFGLRSDMMMRGARYLSTHGFWLTRFYYRMQVMQFDRQPAFMRKLIGGVFIVAGIGVLAFNIVHIPEAFHETVAGGRMLIGIITSS